MRCLKIGSIGLVGLAIGLLNPDAIGGYYQPGEKREEGDVGAGKMRVFGVTLPSWALHNPYFEVMQFGATIRRVADSMVSKKDLEKKGYPLGIAKALTGMMEEVPFTREMMNLETLRRDPSQWAGKEAEDIFVPQASQFAAHKLDTDENGQTIKRKPKGFTHNLEEGIPGLRQTLPQKQARNTYHPSLD